MEPERTLIDQAHPMVSAYLGAGGRQPRLEALCADDREVRRIMELPAGHSVYAISTADDLTRLALGSRGGEIRIVPMPNAPGTSTADDSLVLRQAAPVLSLCFAGRSHLAASDTLGRCLVWNLDEPGASPASRAVEEGVIVALLALNDDEWVGLSTAGRLFFWSIRDTVTTRTIEVPPPPSRALVPLVYQIEAGTVLYPGLEGDLVACCLRDSHVRVRAAHTGPCCVVAAMPDHVLTIGQQDQLAKRWDATLDKPVQQWIAPRGVVCGWALQGLDDPIILVIESGEAAVFKMNSTRLEMQCRLRGEDYRLVTGPRLELLRAAGELRVREEARRVVDRIRQSIDCNESEGHDALHARLQELGYNHVSLCLHAERAARNHDPLGELRARSDLFRILPPGDSSTDPSLQAYLGLLERLWQWEEAATVRSRLTPTAQPPPMHYSAPANCIMEPDVAQSLIIQAATLLGRAFLIRTTLRSFRTLRCQGVYLQAEDLLGKYEQLRGETSTKRLPSAVLEEITWISRHQATIAPTLTVFDTNPGARQGFGYACRICDDGTQTVIEQRLLFDPGLVGGASDPDSHNRLLLSILERFQDESLAQSWVRKVSDVMLEALRRLVTGRLSARNRPIEGEIR